MSKPVVNGHNSRVNYNTNVSIAQHIQHTHTHTHTAQNQSMHINHSKHPQPQFTHMSTVSFICWVHALLFTTQLLPFAKLGRKNKKSTFRFFKLFAIILIVNPRINRITYPLNCFVFIFENEAISFPNRNWYTTHYTHTHTLTHSIHSH